MELPQLSRRTLIRGAAVAGAAVAIPLGRDILASGDGPLAAAAPTREHIAAVARREVGVAESNGTCLKYGPCTSYAWCAMFVEWVWKTAGIPPEQVPSSWVATDLGLWGQSRGLWKPRSSGGGNPLPGDLAVYGEPGSGTGGHVGMVVSVNGDGTINTVDGNLGDRVTERRINPASARAGTRNVLISGYVAPAVLASQPPPPPVVPPQEGSWVSAWAAGRLDVFARDGATRSLRHRYFEREWSPAWSALSGLALRDSPVAVSWGAGRLDLFGVSDAGELFHRYFERGGRWSAWSSLGGVLKTPPAVISWAPGRLDVFATTSDNTVVHKWFVRGSGWSRWQNLGGYLTSRVSVTTWGPGWLGVAGRDGENTLVYRGYAPGGSGWGAGWRNLGGHLTTAPRMVSWSSGELDVFAVDGDHRLIHKYFRASSGWSGWENLGGYLTAEPSVAIWAPGWFTVFSKDGQNTLVYRGYRRGQGWGSQWQNLGGTLGGAPTAVAWDAGRIDVFVPDAKGAIAQRYLANGEWSPTWGSIGTP